MKGIIPVVFILLSLIVVSQDSGIYILNLRYDRGSILMQDIRVASGEAPDRKIQPEIGYTLNLISFDDKILYSFKFNFPLQPVHAPPMGLFEDGKQVSFPSEADKRETASLMLIFPHFKNAERIDIYNPGNVKVLSIDISEFMDVCGDDVCQQHENYGTCPSDCKMPAVCGDRICQEGENYGTCPSDCKRPTVCGDSICDAGEDQYNCLQDCEKEQNWAFYIIFGFIILAAIFVLFGRKEKK